MNEARTLEQKRASVEEMARVSDSCSLVSSHAQMLLLSFHNGLELCETLALDEPCKRRRRTLWIVFGTFLEI